jgi:hypothetical protein
MTKRSAAVKARAAISLSQSDAASSEHSDLEGSAGHPTASTTKRGRSRPSREHKKHESSSDERGQSDISIDDESSDYSGAQRVWARRGKQGGIEHSANKERKATPKKVEVLPVKSSKKTAVSSPLVASPVVKKRKAGVDAGSNEASVVLSKVIRLQEEQRHGRSGAVQSEGGISAATTASALALAGGKLLEVAELGSEEVARKIESLVVSLVNQVLAGGSFELTVPSRASNNQIYIEELDRNVLGDKVERNQNIFRRHIHSLFLRSVHGLFLSRQVSRRQFLNTAHARKAAITTRVVQLVHEVVSKRIHITKRDLFYTDVKLFKDQTESDAVLDDVACMLGCTRTSLHVVASDKVNLMCYYEVVLSDYTNL